MSFGQCQDRLILDDKSVINEYVSYKIPNDLTVVFHHNALFQFNLVTCVSQLISYAKAFWQTDQENQSQVLDEPSWLNQSPVLPNHTSVH